MPTTQYIVNSEKSFNNKSKILNEILCISKGESEKCISFPCDFKIYPIVFDMEIKTIKQVNTCLFGFYLPLENKAIYLIFDDFSTSEYKNMLQDYLNQFIESIEWKEGKKNAGLIGHNIFGFDLPLLYSFCENYNSNLFLLCNDLINSKFLNWETQNKMFDYASKFAILDTLLAKQERGNDRNSLFAFKMDSYLNGQSKLQPKEVYFNWEDMTLKQLCFYNYNDLYYTYLLFDKERPCHALFESRVLTQQIFKKENKKKITDYAIYKNVGDKNFCFKYSIYCRSSKFIL